MPISIKDVLEKGSSVKSRATKFEDKIKSFMEALEFENVDGARDTLLLGGHQIDVLAGHENTLLVLECKSSVELKKKNLKSIIYEFKGKIKDIERGAKQHPVYKKYNRFRYILVVNEKVSLRPVDKIYANEDPAIYVWNEDFLEYYNELYSYLKPYAKYDLLGEMGIQPIEQDPIRVPAFMVKVGEKIDEQGNKKYINMFTFMMNPKDLLSVAFVARREKGKERYYQRLIDKKRLLKIANYIENDGKFPNNIIIAFREDSKIRFYTYKKEYSTTEWPYIGISFGILEFPKDYRSCWIIDGQHRLYAFVNVKKDLYFSMPITAFQNLGIEQQAKFFLDINKNQKPVDADLLWDLNGDMIPSEKDGIISNVVKDINNRNPLLRQIFIPSTGYRKRKDMIKLSAICIAIRKRKLVNEFTTNNIKNPLFDESPVKRVYNVSNILCEYFDVIKKLFPENWDLKSKGFVITNGGISVMIGIFEKIIERIMQKENRLARSEDFEFYLNPLKNTFKLNYPTEKDLKVLRIRCTSEGGKNEVLQEFILSIRDGVKDDLFGGEIKLFDSSVFIEVERKFQKLVYKKLYDGSEEWLKNKIQPDIYGRVMKKLEKRGVKDTKKLQLQLSLGECIAIFRSNKNIFFPTFMNEECGFNTEIELEAAFNLISRIRSQKVHYTGASQKLHEQKRLEIYLDMINKCLDSEE